jgi:hypothetical protein
MNEERERRLAQNEALSRDVNEVVEDIAESWFEEDERLDFLCECSRGDCAAHVSLTRQEYESVRSDPLRFVLFPGHADPRVEREIGRIREYVLVEKTGPGVTIAEETDPRSEGPLGRVR